MPPSAAPVAPLAVHLLWLGADHEADALAPGLYRYFARDPRRPLERGLGIPVRVWRDPTPAAVAALELDAAAHSAVVPIVGDEMVLHGDAVLAAARRRVGASGGRHALYPAALTPAAHNTVLGATNMFRLYEVDAPARAARLEVLLAHALYRFLLGAPDRSVAGPAPPLQLFLSHATADGVGIADALRRYTQDETQLAVFFASNSIAHGADFGREIERDAATAALIAVQTDAYASREWCRREVLVAKEAGRPVVVVNAVHAGESRGFPYLGNVATLRWNPDGDPRAQARRVVALAVREALRVLHFAQEVRAHGLDGPAVHVSAYPPELCTVAMQRRRRADPAGRRATAAGRPRGVRRPALPDEEVALLHAVDPALELATPRLARRPDLTGRVVGLSVSPSPDMARRGWHEEQLDDASVEFARYLLAAGASVAYGGDLREGGITESLLELAHAHDAPGARDRIRVFLYWPYFRDKLTTKRRSDLWPVVDFHECAPPDGAPGHATLAEVNADRPTVRRSLSVMRRELTAAVDARVCLGDQHTSPLTGYSGVFEEVALAVEAGQPVYLVGAFGGATAALIHVLTGRTPAGAVAPDPFEPDTEAFVAELRGRGVAALDNGLGEAENQELFDTPDPARAVALVMLGLARRLGPAPAAPPA